MSRTPYETDPSKRYDDLETLLGVQVARAAAFFYYRRVSRTGARAYDVQDAKQDIYLMHFEEKSSEFCRTLADRAIRREPRNTPPLHSLREPLLRNDECIGELEDSLGAEDADLERVEEREQARAIVQRMRRSPHRETVRAFEGDLDAGQPLKATQRQRKRRLKKAFPEERRLVSSWFRRKDKPSRR